jgi:hypothetical protein
LQRRIISALQVGHSISDDRSHVHASPTCQLPGPYIRPPA